MVEHTESHAEHEPVGDGPTLRWRTTFVPRAGLTFTLRLRPTAAGFQPLIGAPTMAYTDSVGRGAEVDWMDGRNYQSRMVLVVEPRALGAAYPVRTLFLPYGLVRP